MSEQLQIGSCQCLQQTHSTGAVSETVMCFQRNTVAEVVDADQITVISAEGHRHARIFDIRLYKRPRPVVGFQIAPEYPFSYGDLVGWKTLQGKVKCLLENRRINFFFQHNGKTVHRRKIPSLQGGIYDGRKIKLIPDVFFNFFLL